MVVQAVHRSFLGYLSRANSATFWMALALSTVESLAIFCTFFKHVIMTERF